MIIQKSLQNDNIYFNRVENIECQRGLKYDYFFNSPINFNLLSVLNEAFNNKIVFSEEQLGNYTTQIFILQFNFKVIFYNYQNKITIEFRALVSPEKQLNLLKQFDEIFINNISESEKSSS